MTAKRSDHDFILDSRELNLTLGNAVFDVLPDIKAQMKGPDVNLKVEIRAEATYISHEEIKGGGLPVGLRVKECSCFQVGLIRQWQVILHLNVVWILKLSTLQALLIPVLVH